MADVRDVFRNNFKSLVYAKEYLGEVDHDLKWNVEKFYHWLFSHGKLPGKNLIDVGCGPSVRAALVASKYVSEIYNADLVQENCEFVRKWLATKGNENFSKQFEFVACLEGHNDTKLLENRVKKSIKDVLICDILLDNPFHPAPFQQFDIVASSYCFDCYNDDKDYIKGAKGIATLVRKGGYLALVGMLNSTGFYVGDQLFPASNINADKAKQLFTEAGLKVLEVDELLTTRSTPFKADFNGVFTVYATKVQ